MGKNVAAVFFTKCNVLCDGKLWCCGRPDFV